MRVVVPFAATEPKTRLESILSPAERSTVARAMLADVLAAVVETGREPTVLSTAPLDPGDLALEDSVHGSVSVAVDDRPLTAAVDAVLPDRDDEAVAVVMADLALATPDALETLLSRSGDVVVVPGRGSGTNALVVRHPDFYVDYHGTSYLDHCEIARDVGATLETVDSFRLATDVDEPADLVEVLVHGSDTGHTRACLRELGFDLEAGDGRVRLARSGTPAREPGGPQ